MHSGNETTQQYEIDASGSTTSYTYDANGNLTSDGTKTYYWNALNQLVEVKEGTTTIATFEYDGEGRRTEKVAGGRDASTTSTMRKISSRSASAESSATRFATTTARASMSRWREEQQRRRHVLPRRSSRQHRSGDERQRRASRWSGNTIRGASCTQGGQRAARVHRSRVGCGDRACYFYRARYYEPGRARFLSDDPIGLAGGTNQQRYVSNSSTKFADPFGLQKLTFDGSKVVVVDNDGKLLRVIPATSGRPGTTTQGSKTRGQSRKGHIRWTRRT